MQGLQDGNYFPVYRPQEHRPLVHREAVQKNIFMNQIGNASSDMLASSYDMGTYGGIEVSVAFLLYCHRKL